MTSPSATRTRNAAQRGPSAPVGDSAWRNRIVGSGEEAPDQLVANPQNWRVHPGNQRDALRGSLGTVGWVQQVLVNRAGLGHADYHFQHEPIFYGYAPGPGRPGRGVHAGTRWFR